MKHALARLSCLVLLTPATTSAQEPANLWPNDDATEWIYEYSYDDGIDGEQAGTMRLHLDGTDAMDGAVVQRLLGELSPDPVRRDDVPSGLSPILAHLWRTRPELRDEIETRRGPGTWIFQLLPTLEGASTGVGFLETSSYVGGWRDAIADWSWWFLADPVEEGSTFELQLLPDIADDLYLEGSVRTTSGQIDVPAGTFENVVIVDYLVDFGEFTIIDENEMPIGTMRSTLSGWVAFVPEVGPAQHEEVMSFEVVECPTCGPDDVPADAGGRTALASGPTPNEALSWGAVKGRYRE